MHALFWELAALATHPVAGVARAHAFLWPFSALFVDGPHLSILL